MAKDLRFVPPESLVEITNRTLHGRFLLRPSAELTPIIDGAIGRAQRLYDIRVIGYVFLSNHFHMLVIADDAQQLSRFVGYLESKIAKEAGRMHDWRGKFWARNFRAILVSNEPDVQVARLRYLLSQGCKEGLVASPRHWPGSSSTKALLSGDPVEGLWFDRTQEYRARKRGETFGKFEFATQETVTLTPLPCWDNEPEHRVQSNVRTLVKGIEAETNERGKASGRPPLGVNAILNQQAHDKPARSKRSPAPRFHTKSGHVRKTLERAYLRFYWSYRDAARRLQEGLAAEFPPGCFPPPASFLNPHPRTGFS